MQQATARAIPPAIRVLLVDDPAGTQRARELLRAADGDFDLEVASCWERATARLAQSDRAPPDVLLLGLEPVDAGGLEALDRIRELHPEVPVVVLIGPDHPDLASPALRRGAQDCLPRDDLTSRLLARALRHAVERGRADSEHPDARRFARAALDSLSTHLAILSADGTILDVNEAWRRFARTGGATAPFLGENYLRVCDRATGPGAEDAAAAAAGIRRVIAGEDTPFLLEYPCHAADAQRWFALRVTPVHGAGPARAVAAHEDITARKRAELNARHNEQHLRNVLATAEEAVWIVDENDRTTFVNHKIETLFGHPAEAMLGREPYPFLPRELAESLRRRLGDRRRGVREQYDVRFRRPDGSEVWAIVTAGPIRDAEGRYAGAIAMYTDVTARHLAQEQRDLLAAAVEQAGEAIVITGTDGTIQYVNPAFERATGYCRGEAIGRSPRILKSGKHDAAFYRTLWATISRGETWQGVFTNRKKDGTLFDEEGVISPVHGPDGRIGNYVAVKRDVTQRQMLEEQLHQSQKLEGIGLLAGGVAHDFNNLLTVILGSSELLAADLTPSDPRRRPVAQIVSAAERAAALTRQLLAFSRRQVMQPVVLDLNAVVTGLAKMLRRLIPENIELRLRPASPLGSVRADAGQLEQVLINLTVNARDAMPEGGILSIETGDHRGVLPAGLPGEAREDRVWVRLTVRDTGTGMDEATRMRVFEPFFTTKEAGKGTGLGLATAYGIVKQSGGYIWVESAPGRGSAFHVYLPRLAEGEAPVPAAIGSSDLCSGSGTLLVVEDEAPVRQVLHEILTRAGYEVILARSGEEAVRVVRARGAPVDLLVTDVILAGMSGRDAARHLTRLYPGLRVLYVSGHPDETIARHGVLEPGVLFLQKPVTPSTLLDKVREALGRCADRENDPA